MTQKEKMKLMFFEGFITGVQIGGERVIKGAYNEERTPDEVTRDATDLMVKAEEMFEKIYKKKESEES